MMNHGTGAEGTRTWVDGGDVLVSTVFCSSVESKPIKSVELPCRRDFCFLVFFFSKSMGTGGGLGVRLSASGSKSFLFQFHL